MQTLANVEQATRNHLLHRCTLDEFFLEYDGDDWRELVDFSQEGIQKKLVQQGYFADVYLVGWLPGQTTEVHGHSSGGCCMQLLEGLLKEEQYHKGNTTSRILIPRASTFIHNSLYQHRVRALQKSVSLHIYAPGTAQFQ